MNGNSSFEKKYLVNCQRIAEKNGVDFGVGADMFLSVAKQLAAAADKGGAEFYPGMGIVNLDALISDYRAYEADLKAQAQAAKKAVKK